MIQDFNNLGYEIKNWCLCTNNFNAIKDVFNDRYFYNEGDATSVTKAKQIGTELLHAGMKITSVLAITDKMIYEISGLDIGFLPRWAKAYSLDISTIINYTPTALGALAFAYAGNTCLKNLVEAKKSLGKAIKQDYDGNLSFSVSNLYEGIANASTVFPLYYSVRHWGLPGALVAAPLMYASSNYESTNTTAAKIAKFAIVVWTAPVGHILRWVVSPLVNATNVIVRVVGL